MVRECVNKAWRDREGSEIETLRRGALLLLQVGAGVWGSVGAMDFPAFIRELQATHGTAQECACNCPVSPVQSKKHSTPLPINRWREMLNIHLFVCSGQTTHGGPAHNCRWVVVVWWWCVVKRTTVMQKGRGKCQSTTEKVGCVVGGGGEGPGSV